jgi:hypothetical protein
MHAPVVNFLGDIPTWLFLEGARHGWMALIKLCGHSFEKRKKD